MKKIIIFLLAICGLAATAQVTTTRFAATRFGDNTGRALTYAIITTTDATSATLDTITIAPNAWETIVRPSANLADSVCYKFSSTSTSQRVGDVCTFMISKGTGAGRVKFGGSVFILSTASSAVALAANKSLIMRFRWNGSKWIEESRMVQP